MLLAVNSVVYLQTDAPGEERLNLKTVIKQLLNIVGQLREMQISFTNPIAIISEGNLGCG